MINKRKARQTQRIITLKLWERDCFQTCAIPGSTRFCRFRPFWDGQVKTIINASVGENILLYVIQDENAVF